MTTGTYIKALESTQLDSSDYILMATQLLTKLLDNNAIPEILQLQQDYVNNNYQAALYKIMILLDEYAENLGAELVAFLKDRLLHLQDNAMEQKSRRYFEVKFCQAIWNSLGESEFSSLEKLSTFMKEKNPAVTQDVPTKVLDLNLAEKVIGTMRACFFNSEDTYQTEQELRAVNDTIAQLKDRGEKRINDETEKLYSLNPGIVHASSPMPVNERLEKAMTNKVNDLFIIDTENNGYSVFREDVPFVNSISGTVYGIVGGLKSYIECHKEDPNLEHDLNNFIKIWVTFANLKGYHSFAEMLDALNDHVIQNVFKSSNINLNLVFLTGEELSYTIKEAAEYSKKINLQRQYEKEIANGPLLLHFVEPKRKVLTLPEKTAINENEKCKQLRKSI